MRQPVTTAGATLCWFSFPLPLPCAPLWLCLTFTVLAHCASGFWPPDAYRRAGRMRFCARCTHCRHWTLSTSLFSCLLNCFSPLQLTRPLNSQRPTERGEGGGAVPSKNDCSNTFPIKPLWEAEPYFRTLANSPDRPWFDPTVTDTATCSVQSLGSHLTLS